MLRIDKLPITFKIIHGLCPAYLLSLLQQYHPQRNLLSSSELLFTVATVNSVTYGERDFSIAAPILWNSSTDSTKNTTSLSCFKSALRTLLKQTILVLICSMGNSTSFYFSYSNVSPLSFFEMRPKNIKRKLYSWVAIKSSLVELRQK